VGQLLECARRRWLLRRFTIAKRSISARFYFKEMVPTVISIPFGGDVEKNIKKTLTSNILRLLTNGSELRSVLNQTSAKQRSRGTRTGKVPEV
jgi:hypothetical protein